MQDCSIQVCNDGFQFNSAGIQDCSFQDCSAGIQVNSAGIQDCSSGIQDCSSGIQNCSAGIQDSFGTIYWPLQAVLEISVHLHAIPIVSCSWK